MTKQAYSVLSIKDSPEKKLEERVLKYVRKGVYFYNPANGDVGRFIEDSFFSVTHPEMRFYVNTETALLLYENEYILWRPEVILSRADRKRKALKEALKKLAGWTYYENGEDLLKGRPDCPKAIFLLTQC